MPCLKSGNPLIHCSTSTSISDSGWVRAHPHNNLYLQRLPGSLHRDLNQELLKEEEGLVGNRGLVTTYTGDNAQKLNDNQTFNIFISDGMRDTFEAKLLRQVAQVGRASAGLRLDLAIPMTSP